MHKFPLENPYCEGKKKWIWKVRNMGHEGNWHRPSY